VDDFLGWRVWRKAGRPDWGEIEELQLRGYALWKIAATITADGAVDGEGRPLPITAAPPLDPGTHYNATRVFRDGTTRSVLQFLDRTAVQGTPYHYAVTGLDDGSQNLYGLEPGEPMEGSRFMNVNAISITPHVIGASTTSGVAVVPNPWTMDAMGNGDEALNLLMFVDLPPIATLKVFTETGDLVRTIRHEDLRDRETWDQRTEEGRRVKSGIYILVVTDARNFDYDNNVVAETLPDVFVKFVIIR